jgi:methyl-accepting chemotaxis protein
VSLRTQIILVVSIPFFALLGFGSLKISEGWDRFERSEFAQQETRASLSVINLVHYLQVERGQSAGFISSGGRTFEAEISETRAAVDNARGLVPQENISTLSLLNDLDAVRSQVDSQSISVAQMAKFYTGTIKAMLDGVGVSLIEQQDATLAQIGGGLVSLSYAKEAAGLQRAAGANGFGSGEFSLGAYKMFAENGASETQLLQTADLALLNAFPNLDLQSTQAYQDLARIRAQVLASGPLGQAPALTGPEWFALSTAWISELHTVGTEVALFLETHAANEASASKQSMIVTIVAVIGSLLASVLLGLRTANHLSTQFRAIQSGLEMLSRKEFEFTPSNLDAKNEIGHLNRAMEATRVALQAAEQKLVEIEENRIADRGAVIGQLEANLGKLSQKDLDCEISDIFPDEYESLRTSFNTSVRNLKETIEDLASSTGTIRNSVSEISQSSDEMARRTEGQAATLEQAAAAMEQITSSVRSSAEGAASVDQSVSKAKSEAKTSEAVVQNAVSAMTAIQESSEKIAQITGVIDDIAFQTNLLALNAGVEAARAGSAGKGFAVVASEVLGLAQRSAEAATQIKALIASSTDEVERGTSLVSEAGDALTSIIGQVTEISAAVSGIAAQAADQASGLSELNTGILQLDAVTQQNAGMAEETTAASHVLDAEVGKLNGLMQEFRTTQTPRIDPQFEIEGSETARLAG